ncbi:hypothetical protein CVIRNUC_003757 [Coccomyxa viridis]|uniref:Uncharacterized protein n=1 Tax=Coccomyxa viridis TaxID=1274662 RepID=A0AAV1I2S2_9CHLO|nr:hypothetical protein CVIRNUC_003757 [Coccomyxa viridis]
MLKGWHAQLPSHTCDRLWVVRPDLRRGQRQTKNGVRMTRATADEGNTKPAFGILIECDGVLCDTHREGHRVAFNRAFSEFGLDCMHFNPHVYHDLLRCGDGSAEGLVTAFFDVVGWPTTLATADRRPFVSRLHEAKQKHMIDMVVTGEIPLRTGAKDFVQEALDAGAKVATIAGTCSTPEEKVAEAALEKLGVGSSDRMRVFMLGASSPPEQQQAQAQPPVESLSLEAQFTRAQARIKEDQASEFIMSLRADRETSIPLGIDPALLAAAKGGKGPLSANFLIACIATMMLPLRQCAVIAGNGAVMRAAKQAGVASIAVPPPLSARGTFPDADYAFDGFGPGGGITWRRVDALLTKQSA